MPLHLYTDVYASGSVPLGWVPTKGGTLKYPVRNPAVRRYLRQWLPGRWQKVIKQGNTGWANATLMTVGNFTGNGTNDVFVRWVDGEVDLYTDTQYNQLGTEHNLVRP